VTNLRSLKLEEIYSYPKWSFLSREDHITGILSFREVCEVLFKAY
jgi:hypothetical protein